MKPIPAPLISICRAVLFLTVCGLIGWCYETVFTSILWGHFCGFFSRGLLHVPVCPIYGFFAILLLCIFRLPLFRPRTGWSRCICAFLLGSIVSTLLELGCSYVLEAVLNEPLWSYEGWFLNFQGRISLPSSLLFGALTLVLITVVEPLFQRVTAKFSQYTVYITGTACSLILCIDLLLTFI